MKRERKKYLIQNPSEVRPEEFGFKLLNQIFKKYLGVGKGPFTMEIGGVKFTKYVTDIDPDLVTNKRSKVVIKGGGKTYQNIPYFDRIFVKDKR